MFFLFLLSTILLLIYSYVILKVDSIILKSYSGLNSILFATQGLFIVIFGFSHTQYNSDNLEYINKTLIYIIIFEIFLFSIFIFLKNNLKFTKFNFKEKDFVLEDSGYIVFFIILILIIILSEFILISNNVFFQNKAFSECSDITLFEKITKLEVNKNFLQLTKLFADFKYFLLIFLGLCCVNQATSKTLNILLILCVLFCLLLGVIKGQKSIIILTMIFLIIVNFKFLKEKFKKNILKSSFYSFCLLLLLTFFIRLVAHLRNYFHFTTDKGCEKYSLTEFSSLLTVDLSINKNFYFIDFFVTRLNYLIPFSKITEFVENIGSLNGEQYLSNILGLIPRFFWESKPIITNNMNFYAYEAEIIASPNFSVGLRSVGESFLNFGWYGVIVAFFIAVLFYFLNLFDNLKGIIGQSIYIYMAVYILKSDAYFAIIPGIIHSLIGWILFFTIFFLVSNFFRKKTNTT